MCANHFLSTVVRMNFKELNIKDFTDIIYCRSGLFAVSKICQISLFQNLPNLNLPIVIMCDRQIKNGSLLFSH